MEVRPTDLRLNNWIESYSFLTCKWVKVKVWKLAGNHVNNEPVRPEVFKGIPLTEEILIKAGFKKVVEDGVIYFYIVEDDIAKFEIRKTGKGEFKRGKVIIKFVHQLQNGYAWEEGKELDINLISE